MRFLKWTESSAVFIDDIDDRHRELFHEVGELQQALARRAPSFQVLEILHRLIASAEDHFAHEEKLMRASRYPLFDWHRKQHDTVRSRMKQHAASIERGDLEAAALFSDFLSHWLQDHTGVTDRMMGAYLRNQERARIS